MKIILILLCMAVSLTASESRSHESRSQKIAGWFVRSQRPNGLLPSGEGKNYCFTYDQALSAFVFLIEGDIKRAEMIFDFFEKEKVRLEECGAFPGFVDMYLKDGSIGGASRAAGPNAWMLLALNSHMQKTKNRKYLGLAQSIGEWLLSLEGMDGGISGGYDERGNPFGWISTEHNLDCFSGFRDLFLLSGEEKWLHAAQRTLFFLKNFLWHSREKRFFNGADDANFATDVSSWAVCSLGPEYAGTLDFAIKKGLTTARYEKNKVEVKGFDFGATYWESHYPDKDSVWLEGTGQMALAFFIAGRKKERDFYLKEMEKCLTPSEVHPGTLGLPYATNPGTPAGSGWIMSSEPLSVSSAAWYLFALKDFNPFSMGDLKTANGKIKNKGEETVQPSLPVIDDFEGGRIKCLTAYPLSLQMKSDAALEAGWTMDASSGRGAMRIRFEPGRELEYKHGKYWSAGEIKSAWGLVKRRFFRQRDWTGFDRLSLNLKTEGAAPLFRIKVLDRDNEVWQTREITAAGSAWEKHSFSFGRDFSKDPGSSSPSGNNQLDRGEIKEIIFSIRQGKASFASELFLDDLKLE